MTVQYHRLLKLGLCAVCRARRGINRFGTDRQTRGLLFFSLLNPFGSISSPKKLHSLVFTSSLRLHVALRTGLML